MIAVGDMQASEALLQRMMALYVASHYRNTPNDLMLAADAPAHALFVLLGPVDETQNVMPDVLAVLQVAVLPLLPRSTPACPPASFDTVRHADRTLGACGAQCAPAWSSAMRAAAVVLPP